MSTLRQLWQQYGHMDCRDLGSRQLEQLRDGLKRVAPSEITSAADGKLYIELLRKFREAVAENDKLHGENYPKLLRSILSVGEDGLYSNDLRFIFELIQNVDDCDYPSPDDRRLDMRFDFNRDEIVLTYNEVGFTPFNVFAITGIAEAAKNISAGSDEIGEKGIGFKSVFGVAPRVRICSGWFSFELRRDNFTIPLPAYGDFPGRCPGTQMTLFVPGEAKAIYDNIKRQYCRKDALFGRNPLLFLNKLTSLKMYNDAWRSMEFHVSRAPLSGVDRFEVERNVQISVNLYDYDGGRKVDVRESIACTRYSYPMVFSQRACQERYGKDTQVGSQGGKRMVLRAVLPEVEFLGDVGMGALYSFLPTQLKFTAPVVCHVPFKLDSSREFVDPQGENLWFREASERLSELMDRVYMDWRGVVRENIVRYLPQSNESLFAQNNGKERCLRGQDAFHGRHFLGLPLLFATDGAYHSANEVFCFDAEENIEQPERVSALMDYRKALFLAPCPVERHGIEIVKGALDALFRRALQAADVTADALDYLDSVEYSYDEKQLPGRETVTWTAAQAECILRHGELAKLLRSACCASIRKSNRRDFRLQSEAVQALTAVLGEDFDLNDAPGQVANYLRFCGGRCVCLDIEGDNYLPCHNAIVLSKRDPLASFAAFCNDIDGKDSFSIRLKLRDASQKLNLYEDDDSGSAAEYLRELRNIRCLIRDSLGRDAYKSYTKLILEAGKGGDRYIQELLQNADDCDFPPKVLPSFALEKRGNIVTIETNELGFTRANIRAITAIGESTKKQLLNREYRAIGEKGVGFKTVFAVAREVRIYSGEYAFALTDSEPTIPRILKLPRESPVGGTRMELVLRNPNDLPDFREQALLELCLCLRRLKLLKIDAHSVAIEDREGRRIVTIDGRSASFRRFTHSFTVSDEAALSERCDGNRAVSAQQSITCFVPEKGKASDFALYSGLPTAHRLKIPLAIDASFALTTSREQINESCRAWNGIVRREMYAAILGVIEALKREEREQVLRFMKFTTRLMGKQMVYLNDISDCSFLKSDDSFLISLKRMAILPTFDPDVFEVPQYRRAYRFPKAALMLFRQLPPDEYAGIQPASIIDVESDEYDAALNALGCTEAPFGQVFPVLAKHSERFIRQDDFRCALYDYLLKAPQEYRVLIQRLPILPVYGRTAGSVEYVRWQADDIFVQPGATTSDSDYCVLDEELLPASKCNDMLGVYINAMNEVSARDRYNRKLARQIRESDDDAALYRYLIEQYSSGALEENQSLGTLLAMQMQIPLKNGLGEIARGMLFVCDQPEGYFPVKLIQRRVAHRECAVFARWLGCEELSGIRYDEFACDEPLTADDVEALQDEYFANSSGLLQEFYQHGQLSDELMMQYGNELEYLTFGRSGDEDDESYEFPAKPVMNWESLRNHVREQWEDPIRVVSMQVLYTVRKGQRGGATFSLNSEEERQAAKAIYTPEGAHGKCFCQMCGRVKNKGFIEVNNLELLPEYYFPQLRVALCLECSKRFKFFRQNEDIRRRYLEAIQGADIQDQEKVIIPVEMDETLTFTATHLAEIQEILRQRPR